MMNGEAQTAMIPARSQMDFPAKPAGNTVIPPRADLRPFRRHRQYIIIMDNYNCNCNYHKGNHHHDRLTFCILI